MRELAFVMQRCLLLAVFVLSTSSTHAGEEGFCPLVPPGALFAGAFEDDEACPEPCPVNAQIQAVKDAADGKVSLPIHCAYVTRTRHFFGSIDPPAFFLQGYGPSGPAIFALIDPNSLDPVLRTGDVVSLTVTEKGTSFGWRQILAISDLVLEASGQPLWPLLQEVSDVSDLVSNLADYESELISMTATVDDSFGFAGGDFEAAHISTAGVVADPNLALRLPWQVRQAHELDQGCSFHLPGTPLSRFNDQAQANAWHEEDIEILSCPEPQVVSAFALTSTSVRINFDRTIDPPSVLGDGSQFAFDNGLLASAAVAEGKSTVVTTSEQVGAQMYTATVASTVTDTLGSGVDIAANSTVFPGFEPHAVLRVNEVNNTLSGGCDLVELRVITGGAMGGFSLGERERTLVTFPNFNLAAGDIVVVHLDTADSRCNPAGAVDETASPSEQPNSTHSENYDTAYDWYSSVPGMSGQTNVITLYDPLLNIMDTVLLTPYLKGFVNFHAEARAAEAAAAGEWETVDGGVPKGGFVDDNYNAHAVLTDGITTTLPGMSVQRNDDDDMNDKADWVVDTGSWGVINSGQSN